MPSMLVSDMSAAVGAGGTVDVQPAAGTAYRITDVSNDVAFVGAVPDIQTAIRDAVLADAIVQVDPTTDPGKRTRPLNLYISNANYLRITNTGAGAGNIGWFGERVNANTVITDLVTIGAGATVNVQPPAGQTWLITEIGASGFTAAGDINPDVTVGITDGTLTASVILDPTMVRGQDSELEWYIDNSIYLWVTDSSGGGLVFGYSGIIVPKTAIGSVTDVAGGGTLDIQPAATAEWCITEISAETWAGVAPNGYPDITVSMIVGANLSDILEAGAAASLRWNSRLELLLDNTHYLRITEVSGANNEVGVLGYLRRSFS